jgi:hypothetical protein
MSRHDVGIKLILYIIPSVNKMTYNDPLYLIRESSQLYWDGRSTQFSFRQSSDARFPRRATRGLDFFGGLYLYYRFKASITDFNRQKCNAARRADKQKTLSRGEQKTPNKKQGAKNTGHCPIKSLIKVGFAAPPLGVGPAFVFRVYSILLFSIYCFV